MNGILLVSESDDVFSSLLYRYAAEQEEEKGGGRVDY